jgi:glycosylphosphatidylinositol transamidase
MQIQATGTPTGSHGFFLKYGIESITMTGKSSKTCKARNGFTFGDMGRILEAVFRSLNNLLERLHQSFFFYLKTTPNRFISISKNEYKINFVSFIF